jgi:tetratricopeptide (TPR) repeat protein
MNIIFKNVMSWIAVIAFSILPSRKILGYSSMSGKSVAQSEELKKIDKNTSLYLVHANDLFSASKDDTSMYAGHRSHSSHVSHHSHYSSTYTPSAPSPGPDKTQERITPQPADSAETYFNLGLNAGKNEQYDEAILYYTQAIKLNPKHERAYNNLGVIFYKKGNAEKAIEYFKQSIAINTDFAEPYYNLGVVYYNQGKMQIAKDYFTQGCMLGSDAACKFVN